MFDYFVAYILFGALLGFVVDIVAHFRGIDFEIRYERTMFGWPILVLGLLILFTYWVAQRVKR